MAIKNRVVDTKFGVPVDDAYIKFNYGYWSDKDMEGKLQFSVWATATSEAEGKAALTIIEIPADIIFQGIQAKAYAEIKKHPDYLDAVDV